MSHGFICSDSPLLSPTQYAGKEKSNISGITLYYTHAAHREMSSAAPFMHIFCSTGWGYKYVCVRVCVCV